MRTPDPAAAHWLWYPGDFELYHALRQNFSRVERGCGWPAFWRSESFRQRVVFRRRYELTERTAFTVTAVTGAVGYVQAGEEKHPFGRPVEAGPGPVDLSVHVGCVGCVPSVYIRGDVICSDAGWTVEDYDSDPVPAAFNRYFTDPDRDPSEWSYSEKVYEPVSVEAVEGGLLFVFETELTASLALTWAGPPRPDQTVYLGESRAEALDTKNCYFSCAPDPSGRCPRQAVRYAFLPGVRPGEVSVRAVHQYVDIPRRARFSCGDEELERIFEVSAHTFQLCSGAFFLDGIKRDKWIWGGDAYQSLLVNRYLTGDPEVERRTLLALGGRAPVTTHVNTILDYSMLWLLGMGEHFESYGDRGFLAACWPGMAARMALLRSQREEHGFVAGRARDWTFIDWADFDREGPLCAEQMLYAACLEMMARLAPEAEERAAYEAERRALLERIEALYWCPEKGAYIDSFVSGRKHITRHANIFAILFGIADGDRQRTLARTVLKNDEIPAITTPYFRFFELEALCRLGYLEEVLEELRRYWGGMLRLGAVTFWEEYDPQKPLERQYEMYGDPFGKSLCHAWAASPIYLLARYFVGLTPAEPGGGRYKVQPEPRFFRTLDAEFPMGARLVRVRVREGAVSVTERDPAAAAPD